MPLSLASWNGPRLHIEAIAIRVIGNVYEIEFWPESANFEPELTLALTDRGDKGPCAKSTRPNAGDSNSRFNPLPVFWLAPGIDSPVSETLLPARSSRQNFCRCRVRHGLKAGEIEQFQTLEKKSLQ